MTDAMENPLAYIVECMGWAQVNSCPFNGDDIALVEEFDYSTGSYAEEEFSCLVTLKDGRRFRMSGSCDTSGWDCQSGVSAEAA